MSDTSFDLEQRIRLRAYHLWLADGCPEDREAEYHERARELEAIVDSPAAGQLPNPLLRHPTGVAPGGPVEEAEIQENLGEFPVGFTDQGERLTTPMTKEEAHESPPKP